MRIQRSVATAALACLVLAACSEVDITKTATGYYTPTRADDIQILMTKPDRAFVELGSVTVTGFDSDETAKEHNAIRQKAAGLGADAVILTTEGIERDIWGNHARWATGVAIRFKDHPA